MFASLLSQPPASAAMALLRKATVKAVVRYTAGKTGTMSAKVMALAQEDFILTIVSFFHCNLFPAASDQAAAVWYPLWSARAALSSIFLFPPLLRKDLARSKP
jgi:hypothetical protein